MLNLRETYYEGNKVASSVPVLSVPRSVSGTEAEHNATVLNFKNSTLAGRNHRLKALDSFRVDTEHWDHVVLEDEEDSLGYGNRQHYTGHGNNIQLRDLDVKGSSGPFDGRKFSDHGPA